jgi:hypothetical protein
MQRASVAEYAGAVRERYQQGTRAQKGRLLEEFCQTTGYHRKAAIRLLRRTEPSPGAPLGRTRGRPPQYDARVTTALRTVWEASGYLCGKRLAPFLPTLVEVLERKGELTLEPTVHTALVGLSASTIDRRLQPHRRSLPARTRPPAATGSALRTRIPIRTSAEWADAPLGSVQADLVEHCGDQARGSFLCTLTVVEVTTSWCVCRPVKGKAMHRVAAAFHRIRTALPMPLSAVHTDNGSEFLNEQLFGYCQREHLPFTRGRAYRKNDQAWVEQKNWVAVRQQVGYGRYSSDAAYRLLEQLYWYQALYQNFFQPVRKVIHKERVGSKVRKQFDPAATPYQRLLATQQLDGATTRKLQRLFESLNPVKLRGWLEQLTAELLPHQDLPPTARAYNRPAECRPAG